MSDITMCEGGSCPLKESCYRFRAPVNEHYQSWYTEIPYDIIDESCNQYWPGRAEYKDVTNDNMPGTPGIRQDNLE